MTQCCRGRETGSEVRAGRLRQPHALEHLLGRVGAGDRLASGRDVRPGEEQGSGRHLNHFHRVERDVEVVGDEALVLAVDLRLEGVEEDAVPVLECGVGREDRDHLAGVLVRVRVVDLAHGEWFACDRRAAELDDRGVDHRRIPCAPDRRVLPVHVAVNDIELRGALDDRLVGDPVRVIGAADDQ